MVPLVVWKGSQRGSRCQHKKCLLHNTYLSKRSNWGYLRDRKPCLSSGACCLQPSSLQLTGLQSRAIRLEQFTLDWVWRSFNSLIIRPLSIIITLQLFARINTNYLLFGSTSISRCLSVKYELAIIAPCDPGWSSRNVKSPAYSLSDFGLSSNSFNLG